MNQAPPIEPTCKERAEQAEAALKVAKERIRELEEQVRELESWCDKNGI